MVSNWQPAQSLVGDVVSGADITTPVSFCLCLMQTFLSAFMEERAIKADRLHTFDIL